MGQGQSSPYTTTSACLSAATASMMALKMMARDPAGASIPVANSNSIANVAPALVERAQTCTVTVNPSPPAGVHCGTYGTLRNPSYVSGGQTTADTLDACRDLCLPNNKCISYSYTSGTKECLLHNKSLENQGYQMRKKPGPTVRYNRRCFKRTCTSDNCETVIFTFPDETTTGNSWSQNLPFPLQLYNVTTQSIGVGSDGWLDLTGESAFAARYPTHQLPDNQPVNPFPDFEGDAFGAAVFPFYTQQAVSGTDGSQIVALETRGTAPNRELTVVWKTGTGDTNNPQEYSYQLHYAENQPGIYNILFSGFTGKPSTNAVIGMQGYDGDSNEHFYSWAYAPAGGIFATPPVPFSIVFDSNTNTAVPGGEGNSG